MRHGNLAKSNAFWPPGLAVPPCEGRWSASAGSTQGRETNETTRTCIAACVMMAHPRSRSPPRCPEKKFFVHMQTLSHSSQMQPLSLSQPTSSFRTLLVNPSGLCCPIQHPSSPRPWLGFGLLPTYCLSNPEAKTNFWYAPAFPENDLCRQRQH